MKRLLYDRWIGTPTGSSPLAALTDHGCAVRTGGNFSRSDSPAAPVFSGSHFNRALLMV